MKTLRYAVAGVAIALAPASSLASGPQADPDRTIREQLSLAAYSVQHLNVPLTAGAPFTVTVQIAGEPLQLDFEPHSVRAPGFKVVVQDATGALSQIPTPPETTYRALIPAVPGATASASLTAAGLTAHIRMPGGEWSIQPMSEVVPGAARTAHIVHSGADATPGDWGCGMNDFGLPFHVLEQHAGHAGGATDGNYVCQLACDADFEFYTSWASNTTNVTNDINTIVNAVSNIYEVDCQVEFVITQIIIRTSAASNPYTSSTPGTLLGQFQSYWLSNHGGVQRDLAHLFTGRNLDGSVIGIAYLNGVCNTVAFGLSQSRFTSNFNFRVGLTAHETGHNFSAGHCDGGCSPCRIMCSGIGGCTGVVTSFGCSAAGIANYAATRPCLTPPPPPVTALPFFDPFPSLTLDEAKWPVSTDVTVASTASNERSAPNSLLLATVASIESASLNTDAVGIPVFISFWTEHVGVEAGKELRVLYRDPLLNQFLPLHTVTSSGVDQSRFVYHEVKLPLQGFSATGSRIRIEVNNTQFDDTWYVDDVGVSAHCRADINKDRQLTVADFAAFQTAFAGGNAMVADFNDDGNMTIADFAAYQTKFAQGCY